MEQSRNELLRKNHCKIFVVTAASSPTAGVCLNQQLVLLLVSSRERSEISDAVVTENFSGSCRSPFLLVPNYPKQEVRVESHSPSPDLLFLS